MGTRTYYEMLGVARDADAATIKNIFRKMAKKYHPDVCPGDKEADRIFKEINEAYGVLGDEEKRRRYDFELHQKEDAADFGGFRKGQASGHQKESTRKAGQTKADFAGGFRFDFDEFMGAGMHFDNEGEKKRQENKPDFLKSDQQFASFFGFKPK